MPTLRELLTPTEGGTLDITKLEIVLLGSGCRWNLYGTHGRLYSAPSTAADLGYMLAATAFVLGAVLFTTQEATSPPVPVAHDDPSMDLIEETHAIAFARRGDTWYWQFHGTDGLVFETPIDFEDLKDVMVATSLTLRARVDDLAARN